MRENDHGMKDVIIYQIEHWIADEKHIRVIQDCENYCRILDGLFHEHDHVLNECNQHVVHVEIELHFDPRTNR